VERLCHGDVAEGGDGRLARYSRYEMPQAVERRIVEAFTAGTR
jgi:hypothetical protein